MNSKYLILGSTGSIGYAYAKTVIKNKKAVTLIVRNPEKAKKLFGDSDLVEIIQGDATDLELLKKTSSDKDFIFHGINYPYDQWENNMDRVTKFVIEAAGQNKATIVFPGNIYEFGPVKEITDDMIPNPTTKKGKIRLKLYNMLKDAAEAKKCKVIFMRLPDFFGPNVVNGLTERVFGFAVKKKTINWLIRSDIPHQFVYTPDATDLMYAIGQDAKRPDFVVYNYASFVIPSMNDLAKEMAKHTGGTDKVQNMPKFMIGIMGWFMPVMRELKENFYLFEGTVNVNDEKIAQTTLILNILQWMWR